MTPKYTTEKDGVNLELLAPAGGFEQLHAALSFGADAVYLAAERFGMRARAANFAMSQLPDAVRAAHSRGARVYVTCNVMMSQDDLAQLPPYLESVDASGADALIVGDLGAFALARKHAPRCALHVSTQASVANSEAAKMWHSLGASRIVCAREMTLGDIANMREGIPDDLQLEAFVHGAQCMAVSGRCLISSYLTGRSGNKGECTQPCRWNYSLEEEKRPGEHFPIDEDAGSTFIMNAKDLCMVEHLDALRDAGVDSVKVEGRNKKAFYVATVVGVYRRVLDGEPAAEVRPELDAVSHRPYGTGFYFGDPGQACDYDGYEQETMHVADVVECEGEGGGLFRLVAKCRNRFEEGEALEVLSPHAAVRGLAVRNLRWLPEGSEAAEPVAVANRACDLYMLDSPFEVQPGSFLRVRRHRRSARHG